MDPKDPSEGKPNPFYKTAFGYVERRQFLGLLAVTFGWTLLPHASAQEKKAKAVKILPKLADQFSKVSTFYPKLSPSSPNFL